MTKKLFYIIINFSILMLTAQGQGTFLNLDFEGAMPAQSAGFVSAENAIPFWTAEIAGAPQTTILQDGFSAGSPEVVLLTKSSPIPPIDGDFSVMLTGSFSSASVSQTGEIPAGTQSLWFDAEAGGGPLNVTVGNDSLTLFPVRAEAGYEVYGANISAWAGQTQPLTITAVGNNTTFNVWEIDDISFSPNPLTVTPEPDPLLLTALAGTLFTAYRVFAPRRNICTTTATN